MTKTMQVGPEPKPDSILFLPILHFQLNQPILSMWNISNDTKLKIYLTFDQKFEIKLASLP